MVATYTETRAAPPGARDLWSIRGEVNAQALGMVDDARSALDGVATSGSAVFTSATFAFVAADVGKAIAINDASSPTLAPIVTTILARNSATSVTLAIVAPRSIAAAQFVVGTDNRAALQAALTLASVTLRGQVVIPPTANDYLICGQVTLPREVRLTMPGGRGRGNLTIARNHLYYAPTTPGEDLLVLAAAAGSYTDGIGIDGLSVWSLDPTADGFVLANPYQGDVTNCYLRGFKDGLQVSFCLRLNLDNTQIENCAACCLRLTGSVSTTLTVSKGYFRSSPWGVIAEADTLLNAIFDHTVIEGCTSGGYDFHKGSTVTLRDCYTENVLGMIVQVGVNGTSAHSAGDVSSVYIDGGVWAGSNGSIDANSCWLNADVAYSVVAIGADVRRVGKGVQTTTNTKTGVLLGLSWIQVTSIVGSVFDLSRFTGNWTTVNRSGAVPSGQYQAMRVYLNNANGKSIMLEATYIDTNPDLRGVFDGTEVFKINSSGVFSKGGWFRGSATLDFASIAAGAIGTLSVTATGAAVGDSVALGPPSTIEAGLVWSAFVSSANTVTIRLLNTTGSPIDPASATWKVAVFKA